MRLCAALFILLLAPAVTRCQQNPARRLNRRTRPLRNPCLERRPSSRLMRRFVCRGKESLDPLCVATFITLLLVPVLYTIFVVDLKIVKWEGKIWVDDSAPAAPDSVAEN